jgi:GNAT superfamily N-acetyltransferase
VDRVGRLLHVAYAPLVSRGLSDSGATQDRSRTLERLSRGVAFVGSIRDEVVATGTVYLEPYPRSPSRWCRRNDLAFFVQLAVKPQLQRRGIGSTLLTLFEHEARAASKRHLALDTAEAANDLVAFYQRRSFELVESVRWPGKRYRSVILSKDLT